MLTGGRLHFEDHLSKVTPTSTIAALLAAAGLLLPPGAVASWLVTPQAGLPELVVGLWVVKGVLLTLAILIVASDRSAALGTVAVPLLPEGLEQSSRTRGELLFLAVLLVVAAGLRLWALGEGLWYDEIETMVEYARRPVGDIVLSYKSQNNHVLYSLMARTSTVLFGESAWALRLPAALLGIASIWAVYRFGRLVTSAREALLAATFLTFSYHHVWFSQNARGYTGLLLWTVLATWAFILLLSQRRIGWGLILGYGAAMALASYTHLTAVFTAVAHGAVWLILVWTRRTRSSPEAPWPALAGLVWAAGLTVAIYAVVLPQLGATLFASAGTGGTTEWQSPVWMAVESLRGLQRGLPGGWATLVVGMVVVAAGTLGYWAQNRSVTALMILPALVTVAVAAALSHNLWPRFFFFSAGFGALIVVRGVFRLATLALPRRWANWATAALVLAIVGSASTVHRAWGPKQDFEGAAVWVEHTAAPEDRIVVVDLTTYPLERYLERSWPSVDDLGALEAVEATAARTWLLYTFPIRLAAIKPDLWQRVHQAYDTAAVFPGTVGDGSIVVMVTP